MRTSIARFVQDESGATAIEYGLIAAGVGAAVVIALAVLTPKLETMFTAIAGKLG